ncbi:MAG TPA: alpha/beta fold hydrolase [Blastocatellia bacterium]|nr:alpha/beta fold hydrolase [Blastocatellia bacterium]
MSLASQAPAMAGAARARPFKQASDQSAGKKAQREEGSLSFEPYSIQYDGQKIDCELGRLIVKENRKSPSSNLIELAFVRLKSAAARPGPPTIYLDGGPGSSAINIARVPEYMRAFLKLREIGDVILLDQRGVGRSRPMLSRLSPDSLPLDAFASKERGLSVIKERSRSAVEYFKSQGIDVLAYNTNESADDLNDIRKALGAEKVNLVGFSYGTHLGLAAIRRHGEHLNRVVLMGTEGQNHTHKLPSSSDRSIERLARLAANDAVVGPLVPDLTGLIRRVMAKLEKEPVTVRITDRRANKPIEVKVGKYGLQLITMIDLGDTSDLPIFPALFYTIDKGDYSILARFVEKRFNQFGQGVNVMTWVMDSSSGATGARWERINKEAKTAILGDAVNFPFPAMSEVLGNPDLGDAYRSPINTRVPTLFFSGTLDNNTPPFQADEVRRTFEKSTHIVVENAGHEDMIVNPQVQQAAVDFLSGRDVSKVKISLPMFKFVPIPEPKAAK